jgi:hypothetical protein
MGHSIFIQERSSQWQDQNNLFQERLSFANVAISNALLDAQIGKLLVEYGYNTQAWGEDLKP